jgi:hypothetical protein
MLCLLLSGKRLICVVVFDSNKVKDDDEGQCQVSSDSPKNSCIVTQIVVVVAVLVVDMQGYVVRVVRFRRSWASTVRMVLSVCTHSDQLP